MSQAIQPMVQNLIGPLGHPRLQGIPGNRVKGAAANQDKRATEFGVSGRKSQCQHRSPGVTDQGG